MSDIVAFIVGIEKYDHPGAGGWDVPGPCRNALAITDQLILTGVDPKNIFLFLNEKPGEDRTEIEPTLAKFESKGIRPKLPTREALDTCFNGLAAGRADHSRLFWYWSSHGFVDQNDNRILICSDYTSISAARIFDASDRLLRLRRSPAFKCFSEQIFLADVCGNKNTKGLEFGSDEVRVTGGRASPSQIAFFATPVGGYSRGDFSTIALEVLISIGGTWPVPDEFYERLKQKLKDAKVEPFSIYTDSKNERLNGVTIGGPRCHNAADEIILRVYELLLTAALSDDKLREYYRATVDNLGLQDVHSAPGLWQMVFDLGTLQDSATGHISYGLLQFLVRVSKEPDNGQRVREWLTQNLQPIQQQHLTTIEEVLNTEHAEKILVFEVDNDSSGEPSKLEWFVCSRDRSWLSSAQPVAQDVRNWDDLCNQVTKVVCDLEAQFEAQGLGVEISEIHFAVEPPLFNRDFHHLTHPKGLTLGERFILLLRHRGRVYKQKYSPVRKAWEKWANAMRSTAPASIKRIQIPPNEKNLSRLFEQGEGLCYAGFVFGYPADSLGVERQIMNRLVTVLGVPYLYWLQRAPNRDWGAELDQQLGLWLAGCQRLGDFPQILRSKRDDELAANAALLWDDPNFVPFIPKTSPSQG